ncbi:MAG: hypothetical protein E6G23_04890 [Actinobacteria bacterium]|nr:MAG: hypothetical protein E6G23_04890 [Actinomycetota bacterium]
MISSAHGGIAICPGRRRAVVKRVLIASHRGYCAGVERAVETVERGGTCGGLNDRRAAERCGRAFLGAKSEVG